MDSVITTSWEKRKMTLKELFRLTMRPKFGLARQTFIIVIAGLVMSLLLGEVTARILCEQSLSIRRLCFYRHDTTNYAQFDSLEALVNSAPVSLKPYTPWNGFILNSKGLSTPEYQLEKASDSFRVVAIGDSFTFSAAPVPHPYHFTVLLEEKLETRLKREVELINLGVPSVGPGFERKMLELEGLRLNPDLVLWVFFVGNDFVDEVVPQKTRGFSVEKFILTHCYLCRWARNTNILQTLVKTTETPVLASTSEGTGGVYSGVPDDYNPNQPTFEKNEYIARQASRMQVYTMETFPWNNWNGIQQTFTEVQEMVDYLEAPLLVVVIPDENQVNAALQEEVINRSSETGTDFQMDYPQHLLAEFFTEQHIDYMDLLPVFEKKSQEELLYHRQDTHFNAAGNRLAADMIFQRLIEPDGSLNPVIKSNTLFSYLDEAEVIAPEETFVPRETVFFTINGEQRRVLFQHPTSEVIFRPEPLGDNTWLTFGVGINPEAWNQSGDGVQFDIELVDERGEYRRLFSQYIDPKNNEKDRRWFDYTLDLQDFARQRVLLVFRTTPGPEGDVAADWAGWSNPGMVETAR